MHESEQHVITAPFASVHGIAVVVGGSGGIGATIVTRLLADGCSDVASTSRRDDAPAAHGSREHRHILDPQDAAACRAFIDELCWTWGRIHTLVYAAGPHVPMVHLSQVAPDILRTQLVDDVLGFFTVAHAALPAMRASSGSITVVTTAATHRYPVRDGLSAGPKGAIEALARGLAAEEGRFGVRVNCVGPGMLEDGMAARLMGSGDLDERALAVARSRIPLRRFGHATDIAAAVSFLASPSAGFITGQKLDVDGGYGV